MIQPIKYLHEFFLHTTVGVDIFILSKYLIEVSCTVTNVSADSITLLNNNRAVAVKRSNSQLNVTISVNDSLHGKKLFCKASLMGSSAFSDSVNVSVIGKDVVAVAM